ncbi:MAG: hypothetical protein B1H11_08555 [Desulfobacteraceae bacterium 4484_190.1]|nr:MAG: hypothetical protein B1H11_08555 [Desulfobacteraceae bacterium 4484_190.1]
MVTIIFYIICIIVAGIIKEIEAWGRRSVGQKCLRSIRYMKRSPQPLLQFLAGLTLLLPRNRSKQFFLIITDLGEASLLIISAANLI